MSKKSSEFKVYYMLGDGLIHFRVLHTITVLASCKSMKIIILLVWVDYMKVYMAVI